MLKNMLIIPLLFLACYAAKAEPPQKKPVVPGPTVKKAVKPTPAPVPVKPKVRTKLAPETATRLHKLNVELKPLFKAYNASAADWTKRTKEALKPLRDHLQPLAKERFQLIVKVAEQQYLKPECYIVFATGDVHRQCNLDQALWDSAADGRILTQ